MLTANSNGIENKSLCDIFRVRKWDKQSSGKWFKDKLFKFNSIRLFSSPTNVFPRTSISLLCDKSKNDKWVSVAKTASSRRVIRLYDKSSIESDWKYILVDNYILFYYI